MPTEVLVMCKQCGHPQVAGAEPCAVCGARLPEAPLPRGSGKEGPFLSVDLGGGRLLTGEGLRLAFRAGASASPIILELSRTRSLSLVYRPLHEAFLLLPLALAAGVLVPQAMRLAVLGPLVLVSLAAVAAGRRYALVAESVGGIVTRWELGIVRRVSERERRILATWSPLAEALRARGVAARGPVPAQGVPRA